MANFRRCLLSLVLLECVRSELQCVEDLQQLGGCELVPYPGTPYSPGRAQVQRFGLSKPFSDRLRIFYSFHCAITSCQQANLGHQHTEVGGSRPAQVLRRQMTRLSVESDRAELESVDDGISLPVV